MQSNMGGEADKEPILTAADLGTALKYAIVVFLTAWLFLTDSNSSYNIYDNTYRPGRAFFYALCVFLLIIGFKAMIRAGSAIQRQQLEDAVSHHRKQHLERIEPHLRLDRSLESEEVFLNSRASRDLKSVALVLQT